MSRILFSTILTAALALLSTACSEKPVPPPETKVAIDPNLVTLTPELEANVKIGAVSEIQFVDTLRIPGRIQVDEQHESRAGASITGRISTLDVHLGDEVRTGQRLATIKSTELAQYQLNYIKASQQMQLQTKAVDRAKQLLEADVISLAELQRREGELNAASAEVNAARDQLLVLGMTSGSIAQLSLHNSGMSTSQVTSKINGTVIARNARLGQVVAPAEELFVIADLSHVWAVAEVPEQQIAHIREGQSLNIEVPALDDAELTGTLSFVGDIVNPATRTVMARANISNPDMQLKPDMLITILLEAKPEKVIAIPSTAVVRENNADYVFSQTLKSKQYKLLPVTLGRSYHGQREVLQGLQPGDQIVLDGAFHVNNERKRKEME
ncbi:membrane fusion protein, cobalt-zinc-cadmium efflux system [Methylophilus rhizosphaerae]|uniref:Membrane fusion protein, cobalt-zinc-cadmium efflux system n=1 Tax=Methylophilus rhizosphaerae TaxID=492660 RepID=A0A1G9EXX8_9PROT|nr:efflux RND transporter periplasmic adaptor subunit [Methylophilus rhizosphaerae]SDK81047.1 membrane fusion protein, cobalt-zinc-cadmium efflux system [Methylophilus rhizosphaerae]